MKLARPDMLRLGAQGALLGALAGHLGTVLGFVVIGGLSSVPTELLGALLGAVCLCLGWVVAVVLIDGVLFVLYLIVALTPLAPALTEHWVRNDPVANTDAVVVLSSGISSNGGLGDQGVDRLLSGLDLMHAGKARRLITTRAVRENHGRRITTVADQERIVSLVGVSAWNVVGDVQTTHDEALKSAQLLLPAGQRHIAVVTSPLHTRRACATFERVGFTVTCVAAFEHNVPLWHPSDFDERLAAFRAYLYERLGMIKYRYKGWV